MVTSLIFYLFSFTLLLSSVMVILVQNSVHAILFLVLSFICSSGVLVILQCDFLALMFLIIYVGAIAVLFLFVVMMLDLKSVRVKKDVVKYLSFVSTVVGVCALYPTFCVVNGFFNKNPYHTSFLSNMYFNWYERIDSFTELYSIGQVVYTQYVLQFLIAATFVFDWTVNS